MPDIEVLAVEIKRFHGTSAQTLGTAGHRQDRGRDSGSRPVRLFTRESFLDGFEDDTVRGVAERVLGCGSAVGCLHLVGKAGRIESEGDDEPKNSN